MSDYREKRHEIVEECIYLLVRLDRRKDCSLERIPLADLQELEVDLKNLLDTADNVHRDVHDTHICANEHDSTATEPIKTEDSRISETLKEALGGRVG